MPLSTFFDTFLIACPTAQAISYNEVVLPELRGRAAKLVNSGEPTSWDEIGTPKSHFGDSRNLISNSLFWTVSESGNCPTTSFADGFHTHEA